MTNISLYDLIKKISQQKNRPLKIVCDWDDCLFAIRPPLIYKDASLTVSYKQFFKNFWEGVDQKSSSIGGSEIMGYSGSEEEKRAVEMFAEKKRIVKEQEETPNKNTAFIPFKMLFYLYDENFLTTLSDELIKSLKENLISELIIISSHRKGSVNGYLSKDAEEVAKKKIARIKRTFGLFPQFKFEYSSVAKIDGKNVPHRWETIKNKYGDFDLFVDDNPALITLALDHLGEEGKYYVLPDYKCSRHIQANNIFHVKTATSDLKDEDFAIVALEMKNKQLEQELKTSKNRERERAFESNQFFTEELLSE